MLVGLTVSDDTPRAFPSVYSPALALPRNSPEPRDVDETLSGSASFALDHTSPASSSNLILTLGEASGSNEYRADACWFGRSQRGKSRTLWAASRSILLLRKIGCRVGKTPRGSLSG